MGAIRTEVYREEDEDLVGVKVIAMDDGENTIDEIVILRDEDYSRIESKIDSLPATYVTLSALDSDVGALVTQYFNEKVGDYQPPTFRLDENGNLWVNYYSFNNQQVIETIKVRIIWDDDNDSAGRRPANIAMTCSNNQQVVLNSSNNFEYELEVPKYDGNNDEIEYNWTPQEVLGYALLSQTISNNITTFTYQYRTQQTQPIGD